MRILDGSGPLIGRHISFKKSALIVRTKPLLIRLLFFFCWLWGASLNAQSDTLPVRWVWADAPVDFAAQEKLKLPAGPLDSLATLAAMRELQATFYDRARFAASLDSLVRTPAARVAHWRVGPAYEWVALRTPGVARSLLTQVRFRERRYRNKAFRIEEVRRLQQQLLDYLTDHGHPFARVGLDSVRVDSGRVSAALRVERGPLIEFDSLQLAGYDKISRRYLENYLGIRRGAPYSRSRVEQLPRRMEELAFLGLKKAPTLLFLGNRATPRLELTRQRASRFDFIVGFLPGGQGEVPGQRRLNFTAAGTVDWQNQFGLGERLRIDYERLRPQTQELDVEFTYPYLLDLPFGADLDFSLYRRDTQYLEVRTDAGVQYLLRGGNYLKVFVENTTNNLITFNAARVRNGRLPENLDLRKNIFGLAALWQRTDYRYNPREGYVLHARAGGGTKRILPNGNILAINDMLYDGLATRDFQYRFELDAAYFRPLGTRTTLQLRARGGWLGARAGILANEQFRLGGNRILRGFDEETLLATRYGILTLEPRFLFQQNGYFYAFADIAYLEDRRPDADFRATRPLGIGVGLALETPAGILGLSLATGRADTGTPIDFRNPKIHIGYLSLF